MLQTEEDHREARSRPHQVEGLKKEEIDDPKTTMQIGPMLPGEQDKYLATLLVELKELFVWKPNDMPGISKDIIAHEHNIDLNIRAITQK